MTKKGKQPPVDAGGEVKSVTTGNSTSIALKLSDNITAAVLRWLAGSDDHGRC